MMNRINILILMLLLSIPLQLQASPDTLTIIYSGNLDGELEPCGCSDEGNYGGIKRRATMLNRLREEVPGLIALSAGGLLSSDGVTDRIKAEFILKGFTGFGYDAIGLQWRDLSYGLKFIGNDSLRPIGSQQKVQTSTQR